MCGDRASDRRVGPHAVPATQGQRVPGDRGENHIPTQLSPHRITGEVRAEAPPVARIQRQERRDAGPKHHLPYRMDNTV